ncbi:MAG: nucleotidyltransferase domain-containing protein [Acidobacteriota bacterium]
MQNTRKAEGTTDLRLTLAQICRRFAVLSLYVFGSRAKEIAARLSGDGLHPGPQASDVDIAVQPEKGALQDPIARVRLVQELEDLFEAQRVDLVVLPETSAFLAADAVRGELLYCDDEDRQAREELYYLRRAADLSPFQQQRLEGILSGEIRR